MNATAPLDPLRLPLAGTRLIEASAGTGKTWTIAALYLRLALGHGGGVPLLPSQILVMTFTKAATAELRERIRQRLTEAAQAFRGHAEPDDFLRRLMADYPDDDLRARAARQLELAAQWMDEAAVHTIHAWCQRMLGQHAFDSGEAAAPNGIADEAELLAEAVRDYWRRCFFPLDRDAAALVAGFWKTPRNLQQAVAPLLRQLPGSLRLNGRPVPVIDDPAALLTAQAVAQRDAETRVRELWREQGEAVATLLRESLKNGVLNAASYKIAMLDGDRAAFDAWVAGDVLPEQKTLERHTRKKLESATRKNQTTPAHAFFDAIDALSDVQARAKGLAPLVLAHAVAWIARRTDEARRQLGQLGYDDMLKRLDTALQGSNGDALARILATQYPVALVDEFQDTDPLQWRIFQRIYAGHAHAALLLIGDPKQAIYGFRGADIHTYLAARASAAPPVWTLATNYRSTDALVKAVNRVFEHADTQPEGAFGFGPQLPFIGVEAAGRKQQLLLDGQPVAALTLAVHSCSEPISINAYRERSASHAAAQLVHWLEAAQTGRCGFASDDGTFTPLKPSDIAILVRDRNDAGAMRKALHQRGLAHVYLSDNQSVYASTEATDLLSWLQACAVPGSDRAMRAALATPTMGWSLAELDRLNTDESYWETCGEHFRQLHDVWQRHGVLAMLHELLHRLALPARLLARRDGERALTNLLHLAELLQQAATGLDGMHALIRHLAAQIAQPGTGEAAEEQIVRLESEADLIKVVTIHKSKGLEYPVVLLPFVCGFREVKRDDVFTWHDRNGQPHIDLSPDDAAWQQADRERMQEDLRLLYVALTRARHACWLGVACIRDGLKKASGLHKSALGYVLAGGRDIEPDDLRPRLRELGDTSSQIHIEVLDEVADMHGYHATAAMSRTRPARDCTLAPREPWWIASYSALAHADNTKAPQPAPETALQDTLAEVSVAAPVVTTVSAPPQGIHAFPRGATAGTFLHDLLETCADEGFARVAATPTLLGDTIARRCQARGWQAWIKPLMHWLPALLHTPLPLPHAGSMPLAALADSQHYRAELEFWFEANHVDTRILDRLVTAHTLGGVARPPLATHLVNGLLKGFIDLLFEHDGRWYVADYKSNWLGNDAGTYTTEAMRDSVLHARYDLQYAIYTLALHRQLRARLPGYDYDRHIGGVLYIYLRGVDDNGHGVHVERLPRELIEAMDALFADGKARHE